MAILKKLEFEAFGPYRFVGKSVYARSGSKYSGAIFGGLWGASEPIFEQLDQLSGYVAGERDKAALLTADKYDEEKCLLGYTVGRFMKPGTPVPEGLDYFDIPEMIVAKGLVAGEFDDMVDNAHRLVEEEIARQGEYIPTYQVLAEVYTKDTIAKGGVHSVFGYYIGCRKA